jgi:hypothetical protein
MKILRRWGLGTDWAKKGGFPILNQSHKQETSKCGLESNVFICVNID